MKYINTLYGQYTELLVLEQAMNILRGADKSLAFPTFSVLKQDNGKHWALKG
jgi:hypothetical protein